MKEDNKLHLYELQRGTFFKIAGYDDSIFHLERVDGAYSLCKDKDGKILHLAAYSIIESVDKPKNWEYK